MCPSVSLDLNGDFAGVGNSVSSSVILNLQLGISIVYEPEQKTFKF
jgi:hypothetical protein